MINNITNIRGFVKFQGEPGIVEFYNKDELTNLINTGRRHLQMIINEHSNFISLSNKKKPTLYKFEVTDYVGGKIIRYRKSVLFKCENNWKLLARVKKTFV